MKINELILTIDSFDHAAMCDDANAEVSAILRAIADRIDDGGIISACDGLRLRDSNGNPVGEISLDWEQSPEAPDDCEEIEGYYGSGRTPCTVFAHVASGWYCVEGSRNVNCTSTPDELIDGVNVEGLPDHDAMTCEPIDTLEAFAEAIADHV